MNKEYRIQRYGHIRQGRISLNGIPRFESNETDFSIFIKSAYKNFDTQYPKFFKMDSLSKLALIASDVLLENENEKNIALALSNRAASLDTDRRHQKTIQDIESPFASPAVFVYTLPNICLGEISIRHRLFSENSFFIFDRFNADSLFEYANSLLANQKSEKVICGWMEFDQGKYDAFLYVVAKNGIFAHSIEEINRLYLTP